MFFDIGDGSKHLCHPASVCLQTNFQRQLKMSYSGHWRKGIWIYGFCFHSIPGFMCHSGDLTHLDTPVGKYISLTMGTSSWSIQFPHLVHGKCWTKHYADKTGGWVANVGFVEVKEVMSIVETMEALGPERVSPWYLWIILILLTCLYQTISSVAH